MLVEGFEECLAFWGMSRGHQRYSGYTGPACPLITVGVELDGCSYEADWTFPFLAPGLLTTLAYMELTDIEHYLSQPHTILPSGHTPTDQDNSLWAVEYPDKAFNLGSESNLQHAGLRVVGFE